ncbi:hypothetical protein BC628DRAFT_1372757 [Trametes gibbosa]|nr:hypothetical protein BC628DRAFT_1372757 [Trametes gibbosa]
MSWLKALRNKAKDTQKQYAPPVGPPPGVDLAPPPEWQPAPERRHTLGLYAEATEDEWESAQRFCAEYPPEPPRLFPSDVVEHIDAAGCRAWQIEQSRTPRFKGRIYNAGGNLKGSGGMDVVRVVTEVPCEDVCLMSDLPILAGLYDVHGKLGVYYEVKVLRMDGLIAVGTACRPYPVWRLPGWNRLSAGLHLDDLRKFFEDPDGGRDYTPLLTGVASGDTIGLGYSFALGTIFFTHNGARLPDAFTGVYLPRGAHDVYAAVGVEGACEFEVNFGGDVFRWKEGNEWAWRVEGHVGTLMGGPSGGDDELPSYNEVRGNRRTK